MREIKFRAWDRDRREWLKDGHFYLGNDGRVFTLGYGRYGEPHTDITSLVSLVQYTGLKDKNGKEIYEGYVVKASSGDLFEICWDKGGFKARCTARVAAMKDAEANGWDGEVIGNIYENPELCPTS